MAFARKEVFSKLESIMPFALNFLLLKQDIRFGALRKKLEK